MDALPALLLTGYLIGVLPAAFPGLDERLRGVREQLACTAAQVAGAMLIASWIVPTAVAMAVAGLGALAAVHFPPRVRVTRHLHNPTVATAAAMALMMPRALGVGAVIFATVFLFTRRLTLSAVFSLFFVPWVAWFTRGSDIFLLFGAVAWLLLMYSQLDRAERQVRAVFHADLKPLFFRRGARRLFLVAVLAACFALFFLNRYVYHGFGLQPEIFRAGHPELNFVAITFDDGPHPVYTNQVLDILRDREVSATFFMVGRHVDRYPEVARRVLEEGHEVGSHTYHHRNMLNAGEAVTRQELAMTEDALERAAGHQPRLFRPPRGLYNATVVEVSHELGYTVALWSISSQDWLGTSPGRMVRNLVGQVSGGDVLLFHDSGDFFTAAGASRANTVEAVGPLIDELRDRGMRFVTVSELMVLSLLLEGDPP